MALVISPRVREKLAEKSPPVAEDEILECFANREGKFLIDEREEHATDPPTRWFVGQTDFGRVLKVVFIHKDETVVIKTAYDANAVERHIYETYGKP